MKIKVINSSKAEKIKIILTPKELDELYMSLPFTKEEGAMRGLNEERYTKFYMEVEKIVEKLTP